MRRLAWGGIASLALGCSSPEPPTPSPTVVANAPAAPRIRPAAAPTCRPVWAETDRSIRRLSTGSHGGARTDLTIEADGRMHGISFTMARGGPEPFEVDRVLTEAEVAPLREHLGRICAPMQVAGHSGDAIGGGMTLFFVTDADGVTRKVSRGIAGVAAGESHQSLDPEPWAIAVKHWPSAEPS